MALSPRSSKFVNAPNCSVARVIENEVYLFSDWLFHVGNTPIHYADGSATFFLVEGHGSFSLNQAEGSKQTVKKVPLNIAYEIFMAFEDVEEENRKRIERLSHKT